MVALIPGAILFVNNDLSESAHEMLVRQLFITEVMDGYVFDDRVAADPTYPNRMRKLGLRLMVVRTFANRADIPTWTIPDIVLFVKQGLASVECNKFGPPGLTLPVVKLYWGALGVH
jgi:hypothetical protein